METNERWMIVSIGFLTIVMIVGNSMFIPVLPFVEIGWNISSTEAGLILSIFSICAAVTIPFVGYFALRFSKNKMLAIALGFVSIGCMISFLSWFIPHSRIAFYFLLLGRASQGLGVGVLTPLPFMYAGELFKRELQPIAFSMIEVFNGIGKVASPFLGMFSIFIGGSWIFISYLVVALLSFFIIHKHIPVKTSDDKAISFQQFMKDYRKVLHNGFKQIAPIIMMGGVTMFLLFGLLTYYSYELEWIYGQTGMSKAIFFAFPLLFLTLGSWQIGKYMRSRRSDLNRLIVINIGVLLLILIFGIVQRTLIQLTMMIIIFSMFSGILIVCCNLSISSNVIEEQRATIASIYSMVRFWGVALGPPFFSYWMYREAVMFFLAILILIGGAALFYVRIRTIIGKGAEVVG